MVNSGLERWLVTSIDSKVLAFHVVAGNGSQWEDGRISWGRIAEHYFVTQAGFSVALSVDARHKRYKAPYELARKSH